MIRSIQGKTPRVHETAFDSEAAYIVGDVVVGSGSGIWPGVVIRGDMGTITIGQNTNVQDNSVVHSDNDSWIGNGVTLGHSVVWHGTSLGDNCLVGNGAIVNGDVEVGPNSIIGAGSVVLEGTKVPADSMVLGVPGKVVGPTSERHHALIRRTAETYAQKAQAYKAAGL